MSVDVDEADAVVLQESLNKTRTLISQISKSLNKITDSSTRSTKLISPIVERNRNLAVFKKNVGDSMMAVSNVQGIASEAAMYESRLGERVENVKQYITTIHKAEDIMERLQDDEGGGEYKGISENLGKTIMDSEFKLQQMFRELLKPVSTPFDPMVYINDRKPFPYLDDPKIKDLSHIVTYFTGNNNPIDQLYIDNRSRVIRDSLAFLAPFTQHVKKNEKVPYEKGSNGITNYTEALVGFIYNEHSLITDVYKDDHQITPIFNQIMDPHIDAFIKIINNILSAIQRSLANDGLLIFELIDSTTKLQRELRPKLKEVPPKLQQTLDNCRALARTLFRELLNFTDQRIRSLQSLPQDNGVSEATVEVMSKARKFAEYKDGTLSVMTGMKAGSWIPQPKPQWLSKFSSVSQTTVVNDDNPNELLSSFFLDVIDALIISLEIRATQLMKKKQQIGYMLITNITLVEQIISRSEFKNIIDENGMGRLERLKKRALNMFLTGWKQAASYLLDVNIQGKMTSKDREAVKEKFRNFNSEFDDLIKQHKQYNITDPTLKKYLSKDISFIVPLYHRFHDKHAAGDFTKHTEKYIKYDKRAFDQVIDSLGK
ncbi:Exocyst complex protein EXO70 [Cyberlindnera fabianii]|uniref:Exocyst complex protein EXO70 n=1 Tax=Cyberlindnera fabianii TaxID=36022 RepID=A0A1V2LD54_CYBFA|nr:Exocyst complex protein EXO70 [Cyberlindnera fabianii]